MSRRLPEIDWPLTHKVREAVRNGRYVVIPRAEAGLAQFGLNDEDLEYALLSGVVLTRRRRDEQRTAIDGYKHFLSGVTAASFLLEVVFKFERWGPYVPEELVVVITFYGGRV